MDSMQVEQASGAPRGRPGKAERNPAVFQPAVEMEIEDENRPRHFTADEWHEMVATAAYYRAQARGFVNGSAEEDWYEAEAELRAHFDPAETGEEGNDGGTATGFQTKGE